MSDKTTIANFNVDGQYLTYLAREQWAIGEPLTAVKILEDGLEGMTRDIAILICTGKKRLCGSSNTSMWLENDNVTEYNGILLDAEKGIKKLNEIHNALSEVTIES